MTQYSHRVLHVQQSDNFFNIVLQINKGCLLSSFFSHVADADDHIPILSQYIVGCPPVKTKSSLQTSPAHRPSSPMTLNSPFTMVSSDPQAEMEYRMHDVFTMINKKNLVFLYTVFPMHPFSKRHIFLVNFAF